MDSDEYPLEGLERAPELFVDGAQGLSIGGPISKLNLFSFRIDPANSAVRKLAVTSLVMPTDALVALRDYISKALEMRDASGEAAKGD